MEAARDGSSRRNLVDGVRWIGRTRAVRFPLLFALGAAVTFLISRYVQENYIELCQRFSLIPGRCVAVSLRTAYATGLGIAGLVMLIAGPVVNSLYHLVRYGQQWEATRVETAISNYPLLAGFIYLLGAGLLVFV